MIKNIMIWNCHGASSKSFISQVRTIINGLNLEILVLLETRIARHKGENIPKNLGLISGISGGGTNFLEAFGWPRNLRWSLLRFFIITFGLFMQKLFLKLVINGFLLQFMLSHLLS